MVLTAYVALLRKQADSDFGVEFPDFPGCITAGVTLEDAQRMAAEALLLHVEGMMEDGYPIPEPSGLDEILTDPSYSDAATVVVEVPIRRPRQIIIRHSTNSENRQFRRVSD